MSFTVLKDRALTEVLVMVLWVTWLGLDGQTD